MTAPDTTAIRSQMDALAGHTPGPWFSSNHAGDWGLGGAHHIHVEEANPYEWDQAICHVEYQTPYCLGEKRSVIEAADRAASNARLIAAAPDMRDTILALCAALDDARQCVSHANLHADCAIADMTAMRAENERLRRALEGVTERYVAIAASGDAGFWDPETEPEVIAARAAIAQKEAEE